MASPKKDGILLEPNSQKGSSFKGFEGFSPELLIRIMFLTLLEESFPCNSSFPSEEFMEKNKRFLKRKRKKSKKNFFFFFVN